MTSWLLPTREATRLFGETLGRALRPGMTIALTGDLGVGKTTLTQAIARGLGIASPVTSPTFGLVHEYPGAIPMFHFDPYRLQRREDLIDLGLEEYFERGGVVVIEWADKFPELLPDDLLTVKLEIVLTSAELDVADEATRLLNMHAAGEKATALADSLASGPDLRRYLGTFPTL